MTEPFAEELAALDAQALRRKLRSVDSPCGPEVVVDGVPLVSFCSNDYLGLAADPALIEAAREGALRWGCGSGSSALISGHMGAHEALERRLADFVGMERALVFSTGYMANLGVVPALVGRGDAVFSDELNHASLIDAARLSRAEIRTYPHLDLGALDNRLAGTAARRKLVITDAVFSMDGDLAPLPQILALCERHDAWLMVDDAHGFGVLGPQGRGSLRHFGLGSPRLIYMGTLSKAAGVSGAFVAGAANVVEWLVQKARTYIFTTAEPPLLAHALLKSVELIEQGDARRRHLAALVSTLQASLTLRRWKLLPSASAILPLVIGENAETLAVAAALLERGLWTPAIRPPTVPAGTSRLRITLSAVHREEHVARLAEALLELESRFTP